MELSDQPVIPVFFYVRRFLVKPYVKGIYHTALDLHPLTHVWIDHAWGRHVGQAVASPP